MENQKSTSRCCLVLVDGKSESRRLNQKRWLTIHDLNCHCKDTLRKAEAVVEAEYRQRKEQLRRYDAEVMPHVI